MIARIQCSIQTVKNLLLLGPSQTYNTSSMSRPLAQPAIQAQITGYHEYPEQIPGISNNCIQEYPEDEFNQFATNNTGIPAHSSSTGILSSQVRSMFTAGGNRTGTMTPSPLPPNNINNNTGIQSNSYPAHSSTGSTGILSSQVRSMFSTGSLAPSPLPPNGNVTGNGIQSYSHQAPTRYV